MDTERRTDGGVLGFKIGISRIAYDDLRSRRVVPTGMDRRIGVFHARMTRDGTALARDGQPYFAMNRLAEGHRRSTERGLYEIQFEDGLWMLVREDDLVAGVIGPPTHD